jgi:hypothetical protein
MTRYEDVVRHVAGTLALMVLTLVAIAYFPG